MDDSTFEPIPESVEEDARGRYYRGESIPSPAGGGVLEPVRVRSREEGGATVILECSASSVRYGLSIPEAKDQERRKVREMLRNDEEPHCPRHGSGERLVRMGESLGCTRCGVVFATVR